MPTRCPGPRFRKTKCPLVRSIGKGYYLLCEISILSNSPPYRTSSFLSCHILTIITRHHSLQTIKLWILSMMFWWSNWPSWVWHRALLRATPQVLSMWPCKLKLDKEKLKHASLAQQNGFGPTFLHSLLRLVEGTAKPITCCWLCRLIDWSKWITVSTLAPICNPSFSFVAGVGERSILGHIHLSGYGYLLPNYHEGNHAFLFVFHIPKHKQNEWTSVKGENPI